MSRTTRPDATLNASAMEQRLSYFVHTCLTFLLAASATFGQAFIPDQRMRDWLNEQLPGSVDGAGIFDTEHPGIATLATATLQVPWAGGSAFMTEGVQHLSALRSLNISVSTDLIVPVLPESIEFLSIYSSSPPGTVDPRLVHLSGLPSSLDTLHITGYAYVGTDLVIDGENDGLDVLVLDGITDGEWSELGGIGHMQVLSMVNAFQPTISLSACAVEVLDVNLLFQGNSVDLSSITADSCHFLANGDALFTETMFPAQLRAFWLQTGSPSDVVSIPPWPASLERLHLGTSQLSCLPPFPESLTHLDCYNAPQCIPNWPSQLTHYTVITPDSMVVLPAEADYCSLLGSDCPGASPTMAGRIALDLDADGIVDPEEPAMIGAQVSIAPGGQMTGCDEDGNWDIGLPIGDHAATVNIFTGYPYSTGAAPGSYTVSLNSAAALALNNDFAVALIPGIEDLRVILHGDPARPGFGNLVYVNCMNYGTMAQNADFTFTWDADQSLQWSSQPPANINSNSATWSFPAMPVGATEQIVVTLYTDPSVPLQTAIEHSLTAMPVVDDEVPMDNTTILNTVVVGSYDPNDKLLTPAVLSQAQVAQGEIPIEYTIRFQNTGTFLAERVVILDTLSDDLQWESMRFIASSHQNHWYITDGVLHVIHNDIMLADSASDEPGSHGFVKFSMLPETDLLDGAEIVNIAHIVFDFNEPIVTQPAIFRVDVLASVQEMTAWGMEVHPNPVRDRLWITLPQQDRAPIDYVVQDLLGRNVLTGRTRGDVAVDVNGLPSGVFVLTAKVDAHTFSTRFVKQ